MSILYKNLFLLKLKDIYKLQLAKFMFKLHNNCLPKVFYDSLITLESVHEHNTRLVEKNVYFKPPVKKNIGKETLLYRGGKLWGSLDKTIKKEQIL